MLMGDLGGVFGGEVNARTLMSLLDSDGSSEISWEVTPSFQYCLALHFTLHSPNPLWRMN